MLGPAGENSSTRRKPRPAADFQALFQAAPGSFLVLDPDLVIVAVTDAYLRDTMTSRADLLGKGIFEAFPDNPDDPAATGVSNLRASLNRVLRDHVPDTMAVQKYDIKRPGTGTEFEVRYWSPVNSPVLGPGGRLTHIIHRVQDVTDYVTLQQRQAEGQELTQALQTRAQQMEAEILARSQELQTANAALRAANEAKNDFLSRVSHELRTPMNAILGFGELLGLGDITAEHQEWVAMMLKASRHLLMLLDDVLDISRMEGRNLSLSMEAVPVQRLITDALELVRPLSTARGVHLDPVPPAGSQHVHADHQRARQVLLNLLSNAIKYNHPGGKVSITTSEQPEGQLRISVADTGRGISQEDMARLFTPFERLDAAQAGIEGTGLGLALSRQLVQAMGGTAGVTSSPGVGSVFWIELATTEPAAVTHKAITRDALTTRRDYTSAKTVLYVEDMVENIRLVEQILKQRPSVTLIPAMLGGVALDLARQHHPDLVLLDLHLPDMPGEQVLNRLRADPATSNIPVIILSADATQHHISQLTAAGANAYLTKPISVRALLHIIDQELGEPHPTDPVPATPSHTTTPQKHT
jgi:signal transduction histidine kinase/ActR/RegA family two-component response regulator